MQFTALRAAQRRDPEEGKMLQEIMNFARRAGRKGERAMLMLNVGGVLFGFRVDSITEVPDVNGRLWRMTYEKNGAEVIWLDRKDEVKTFAVAFRTLPEDDTGVAHILEHSVLAGSDKYPVKSPFGEMRKSSACVFMNAMTARDATYYPFSTRNDADYLNLADVYLDAVFHPKSLRDPLAFRQEGWHYELSPDGRELSVNGVVYNEMKGVFAQPESRIYRELMSALYPDVVYGHDSGGVPEKIPDLTYGKYCDFHRRFYHPSTARIFLDGAVDLKPVLQKLDAFLSPYERIDFSAKIGSQRPVDVKLRLPYESAVCENKTMLAMGWSAGTAEDLVLCAALDVLTTYLCGSNEAPLTKALLEKRLCRDVSMHTGGYWYVPLSIFVKDTSEDKVEGCRRLVREFLAEHCRGGFDRKRLMALIDRSEFAERELNTSRPKGLYYLSRILRPWLYGGDPARALSLTETCAKLREGVGSGLFERLVREKILENPHQAEIVMVPDPDMGSRRIAEEKAALRKTLDEMTSAERESVVREVAELKHYQETADSQADVEKLPRLKSKELSPTGPSFPAAVSEHDGVTRIVTRTTADGVFYASFFFPLEGLDAEELVRMPLYATLHGKMDTKRHAALELQTLLASDVGRLTFSTVSAGRGRYLKVSVAGLADKAKAAFLLLGEVLNETKFDDLQRMATVLRQSRLSAERSVSGDGRSLALRVAYRGSCERWTAEDILHGERQLRWLQQAEADAELSKWLGQVRDRVIRRDGVVVSQTENLPGAIVDDFLNAIPEAEINRRSIACASDGKGAYSIDGDTGFAAWVAPLPKGTRLAGPMRVASRILSLEYLHNEVREIGGAYGVIMRVMPSGFVECSSYRDPNPTRSLEKMARLGDALRNFLDSGADLDRYLVATVAHMEPYRSSADEAARPADLFIDGRSDADEARIRAEVLATTREDLRAFADVLDDISPTARKCIVGGKRQLSGVPADAIESITKK